MEVRELTCINCPLGCSLTVTMDAKKVKKIEGNTCKKGADYAGKEVTSPTRILTTSVRVENGTLAVVSVKSASDLPKEKISECARALKKVVVKAPVEIGEVIYPNICNTGVAMIATRNVEER